MTALDGLPPWLMAIVAFFLVLGSTLTLLGAFGLFSLKSFYARIHAPTLGTSWGAGGILIASLISWSWVQDRLFVHELVIGFFIILTTPVTLMLLGRAALHRDRAAGVPSVPPAVSRPELPPGAAKEETASREAPDADTAPTKTSSPDPAG